MKFSDEFLKSYAGLFGQQAADAFLIKNMEKYTIEEKLDKAMDSANQVDFVPYKSEDLSQSSTDAEEKV